MIIIGLTGRNASGKTTAGDELATRGFTYLSLSDVIALLLCSMMIINAGIRRVVYNEAYPLNDTATRMLKEAGVDLVRLKV